MLFKRAFTIEIIFLGFLKIFEMVLALISTLSQSQRRRLRMLWGFRIYRGSIMQFWTSRFLGGHPISITFAKIMKFLTQKFWDTSNKN